MMTPKLNDQDRDLLEFVATAQRITHRQLFEVALTKGIERNRKVFEWRVRRLAESGLVKKHRPTFLNRKLLYTITQAGILTLEDLGIHMLWLNGEPDDAEVKHQIPHFLEVNRVHIALIKSGTLIRWTPGRAIRVLYQFDKSRYAKIYDAAATIIIDSEVYEIGLEYERSLKRTERYKELLAKLSGEDNVDAVVYLCPNRDIFRSLSDVFSRHVEKPVFIAQHEEFVGNPLDGPLEWRYLTTTMRRALAQIRQQEKSPGAASRERVGA